MIDPAVAPAGTVVVILVTELTVNTAGVPLNVTLVAPVKLSPVIVTLLPTLPEVGEKLSIDGATVKVVVLLVVAAGVVTDTVPVLAPDGTTAVIWIAESTWKLADTPLNATVVAPMNPVPATTTV